MLVLLKLVKPKVQLIDQNDSMVNAEDVLHVVVPVAVQEVNDDSTARVVIQNHPKRFLLQSYYKIGTYKLTGLKLVLAIREKRRIWSRKLGYS